MTIEGFVKAVMETYPLQLKVEAGGAIYHVSLRDRTCVSRRGRAVDSGGITPSTAVRITGPRAAGAENAITAEAIEILCD